MGNAQATAGAGAAPSLAARRRAPPPPKPSPRVAAILDYEMFDDPANGADEAARIARLHAALNTAAHEIRPRLLLGGYHAAAPDFLLRAGVTHVLNCLDATAVAGGAHATLTLDLEDVPEQRLPLRAAAAFIAAALAEPAAVVLVHCAMGVSRSAACVVAHLLRAEGGTVEGALKSVRAARPQAAPNEGFLEQLCAWEAEAAAAGGAA